MKKIIYFILTILLIIPFTLTTFACSCVDNSLTLDRAFTNDVSVDTFNETATYSVSFLPNATSSISVSDFNGTYTTKFNSYAKTSVKEVFKDTDYSLEDAIGSYDGNIFSISNEMNVTGKYTVRENTYDFTGADADYTKSEVFFKNIDNYFLPIASVKEVKNTTFVNQTEVKVINYSIKTLYIKSKAINTITALDENTKQYFISAGILTKNNDSNTRTLKKLSNVYDNDQLLFLIRAFTLKKNFNQNVSVYESVESSKKSVNVSISAAATTMTCPAFVNIETSEETPIECYKTNISLGNNTYAGTTKVGYYAANKSYHNILLKYEDPIAYLNGKIVYQLTSLS